MRKILAVICLLFVALGFGSGAHASGDKKPPKSEPAMRFALVRSNAPNCEPLCPQWVSASGQIVGDTAVKFERFMKKLGNQRFPIVISSGGGRVDQAMQMGRLIRKLKLDVAVGVTAFSGCSPDDGKCRLPKEKKGMYSGLAYSFYSNCNSACPLLIAAGTRRVVGSWAFLGVHQITTHWTSSKLRYKIKYRLKNGKKLETSRKLVSKKVVASHSTTKINPKLRRDLEAYFANMGVDSRTLDIMLSVPASEIRQLKQVEMLDLRLITSLDQVDLFTGPSICKMAPPAQNCVSSDPAFQIASAPIPAPAAGKDSPTAEGALKLAKVPDGHAMWFVEVRSDAPNCRSTCPHWISAEGRLELGTAQKFEKFLRRREGMNLPIVINSTGGDILEAIALGNSVRRHNLDVSVGKTRLSGCEGKAGACDPFSVDDDLYRGSTFTTEAYCGVICSLVLASGVKRYAGKMTYVGLGMITDGPSGVSARDAGLIRHQYRLMGVEDAILEKFLFTDRVSNSREENKANYYSIRKLQLNDMLNARLVTGLDQVDVFSSPAICEQSPPAANCRAGR